MLVLAVCPWGGVAVSLKGGVRWQLGEGEVYFFSSGLNERFCFSKGT